ncbi:MAG: formyltransferase family protein [Salibacteraceae bacterium]
MKALIFLGSKEIGYECLLYLIEQRERLGVRIAGVLTNDRSLGKNGPSIKELCAKQDLKLISSLDQLLEQPDCDFLVSVQYHEILKTPHIRKARKLAVNLHMAPLPEYRGANQFSFAIIDRYPVFGTTIHQLEESVDGGAILFEKRFPVPENIFVKALYQLTFDASIELFQESIGKIINEDYQAVPQEQWVNDRPTAYHWRKEIDRIKQIDGNWDKEKQARHFRATFFPPFPPPFMMIDGQKKLLSEEWYHSLG